MAFLYEHGWLLFILSEGLTWLAALVFLISRYRLKLDRLSHWCLLLIVLCTIFQALLALVNYYFTGKVSFFQVVIIVFIIYASTLGKSDFERLDTYIQHKCKRYRKFNEIDGPTDKVRTYIKDRQQLFFIHTTALFVIHFAWFMIDSKTSDRKFFLFNEWIQHPHQGFYNNPVFNIISYVWSIVYIIDVSFFLSCILLWWIRQLRNV
ncbi:hypothetical protein [Alkalihalobacillus deserti]|uniref:hypothetical protein n=1 Tax=Alkalihalobacillus deserti TaxID=2879466 RepID=UPI001D153EDB|nr:hypothetical protein [Alkalihalobacillus deserti]